MLTGPMSVRPSVHDSWKAKAKQKNNQFIVPARPQFLRPPHKNIFYFLFR